MSGGRKLQKIRRRIEHWQIIAFYLVIYDIAAVNLSYFGALWLRFDLRFSSIPETYLSAFLKFAPFYTVFCILVFAALRLYNSLWRFASISELNRVLVATAGTTLFQMVGITVFVQRMPVSYYLFGIVIQFWMTLGIRFAYRFVLLTRKRAAGETPEIRVMLIGAGTAGILPEQGGFFIFRELKCRLDASPARLTNSP